MKNFVFGFLLLSITVFASEQEAVQRVYAHLILEDYTSAVEEALSFLPHFPSSKDLYMAYLKALSENGDEMKALDTYKLIIEKFPEEKNNRTLLENLAWGVLKKGKNSSQLPVNVVALLGATYTSDARALPLLIDQMRDSNAYLRAAAVRLSSMLGDYMLQQELFRLLQQEKVWYVRVEVINALGNLRVKKAKAYLQELVASQQTLIEERASAIIALASIYDKVERKELEAFTKSDRAGLRQLVCQLVQHFDAKEHTDLLIQLTNDRSPDVRVSALTSLGLMGQKDSWPSVSKCLSDPDPAVAITASWLAVIFGQEIGLESLEKWIQNPFHDWSRASAAALAITGKAGEKLSSNVLRKHEDPFVRATIAIGLIGQRKDTKEALKCLFDVFSVEKGLWMWDSRYNPLFRTLAPSAIRHIDQIPNYPTLVDQLVRIEVLSILSMMRYPKAQIAVRDFLQKGGWGVTSAASATLISEGDDESLAAVKSLIHDKDEKIRIQAALMLAIVGSDFSALKVLEEAYPNVDREMKIHILEAIAYIKDPSTIPFLLQVLSEPFQVLRIVAASVIIQCLNN